MQMYLSPRHAEIIQMARDNGRVLVDDLAGHFGVTPQTIRKDLNDLCDQRLLTRVHGGALFPSGIENMQYEARRKIAASEKEAMEQTPIMEGSSRCPPEAQFSITMPGMRWLIRRK